MGGKTKVFRVRAGLRVSNDMIVGVCMHCARCVLHQEANGDAAPVWCVDCIEDALHHRRRIDVIVNDYLKPYVAAIRQGPP